jgi:WhiB family redox-sensing transcriptional regulator
MTPYDWMSEAACQGVDSDLFFPERGDDLSGAKAVCRQCPVREDCLEHALVNREHYGIWGGMSERERKRIRRIRARLAQAS